MWMLIVVGAAISAVSSVNRPASGSLVPEVVPERDLAAANALFAALENLVVVLGPLIGGLFLLVGDATIGLAFNAVSFLASTLFFGMIGIASRGDAVPGTSMLRQFATGWRVLVAHRVAFALVVLLVIDSVVFAAMFVAYGPLSEHLGTGSEGYSYLVGSHATGGVIGALLADRIAARPRLTPVIVAGFALECLPLTLLTVTHAPAVAVALLVVSGLGMVVVDVLGLTALQRDLPREVLGRAGALMNGMVTAANAVIALLATIILSRAGLTALVIIIGLGIPLVALLALPPVVRADHALAARAALLAQRVDLMTQLDLFTGATRLTLEGLAQSADEVDVGAGTVIIRQGEAADALWLLAEGTLAIGVEEAGRSNPRPDVVAPGYVGELGLLRRIPRTATVTASTDCRLLKIKAADFFSALDTTPVSTSMLAVAGERLAREGRRLGPDPEEVVA
jgi:MFS family permease